MEYNKITTFETFKEALNKKGIFKDNFGNVYDFKHNTLNGLSGEFTEGANNFVKNSINFRSNHEDNKNRKEPFVFKMKDLKYSANNFNTSIFIFFLDDCKNLVRAYGNLSCKVTTNNEKMDPKNNEVIISDSNNLNGEVFYNKIFNHNKFIGIMPSLAVHRNNKDYSFVFQYNNNKYLMENSKKIKDGQTVDCKSLKEFEGCKEGFKSIPSKTMTLDASSRPVAMKQQNTLVLFNAESKRLETVSLDDFVVLLTVKNIPQEWSYGSHSMGGIKWEYSTNFNDCCPILTEGEQEPNNEMAKIQNHSTKPKKQK